MPWKRMRFKSGKAFVRVDERGAPIVEGGRVEIRYKEEDDRIYKASPANIGELDGPPVKASGAARTKPAPQKTKSTFTAPLLSDPKNAVVVWTDGACSGNPGEAGAGVLMTFGDRRLEVSAYLGRATNNIAELAAIKIALERIKSRDKPVRIYTDSAYALGVLTRGWKAKKNPELVAEIKTDMTRFDSVEILKVPGHAGVAQNERADELARMAVTARETQEFRYP